MTLGLTHGTVIIRGTATVRGTVMVTVPVSALAGVGVAGASVGAAAGTALTTVATGVGVRPTMDEASVVHTHTAVGAGVVMAMVTGAIIPVLSSSTIAVWLRVHRRATV